VGTLPGAEIAQYGIGFFAVAGLIFVVTRFFDVKSNNQITNVIENNTKAMEQLVQLVQSLQINMTRQEAKIDELLERARR